MEIFEYVKSGGKPTVFWVDPSAPVVQIFNCDFYVDPGILSFSSISLGDSSSLNTYGIQWMYRDDGDDFISLTIGKIHSATT
jgi:hypothetical protein